MCLDQGPSWRQKGWSQPVNEAREKVLVKQSSTIWVMAKDRFGSSAEVSVDAGNVGSRR
jgi:hypothetical protein